MSKILVGCLLYEADENGFLFKLRGVGYIKMFEDEDGYLKYALTQDNRTYNLYVHRHIWEFHNGPVPDGMTVDHIDEDKHNNLITNLQLLTPEENAIKGNARHWVAISPEGVEFQVYNLEKFCRENKLHSSHLRDNNFYKGWKCYERK